MEIGDQLYLYRQQARRHTSDAASPILADIALTICVGFYVLWRSGSKKPDHRELRVQLCHSPKCKTWGGIRLPASRQLNTLDSKSLWWVQAGYNAGEEITPVVPWDSRNCSQSLTTRYALSGARWISISRLAGSGCPTSRCGGLVFDAGNGRRPGPPMRVAVMT